MKLYPKKPFWIFITVNIPFIMVFLLAAQQPPTLQSEAAVVETIHFVDQNQQPLSHQTIRLLCYESAGAPDPLLDILVTTDAAGALPHPLPERCLYLAALALQYEKMGKADHGVAYSLYYTNWAPGTSQAPIIPANGQIEISAEQKLVLFNIVTSIEWEAEAKFTAEFYNGLAAASGLLYDLSEGQMAIGNVEIVTNGERWSAADLRVRAANDYRPSAYVGGIVAEPTSYDIAGTTVDPIYAPGAIYLGRYWDGADAIDPTTGSWAQPNAYRTLVHEWAHYALFLYDEYQQENGDESYCVCVNLINGSCGFGNLAASLMAYHYTADELWFTPLHGNPAVCQDTDQWHVHGQSDWRTLTVWPRIQGNAGTLDAPSNLTAGPILGLTEDLFGRVPEYATYLPTLVIEGDPSQPPTAARTIDANIAVSDTLPVDSHLPSRVYLFEEGSNDAPDRILYQGTAVGLTDVGGAIGELNLLGVTAADEARVFVNRHATNNALTGGKSYVYPEVGQTAAELNQNVTLMAEPSSWLASTDLTYELSGTLFTTMTVHLTSAQLLSQAPTVRLCDSDAAVGCNAQWEQTMSLDPGGAAQSWVATFNPLAGQDELPLYAVVHIDSREFGERIVHYQVAGGVGPAHVDAYAPLRDGQATVSTSINIKGNGDCNRVFIATADNFAARLNPLGQVQINPNEVRQVEGVLSWPIDIDVVLTDNQLQCGNSNTGDHALQVPMILTYFYGREQLNQLGISDGQLYLLHFTRTPSPTAGTWQTLTTLGSSQTLNWLSTQMSSDGIYAIGWVR